MKPNYIAGLFLALVIAPVISMAEVLVYMPLGKANEVAVVDADMGEVVAFRVLKQIDLKYGTAHQMVSVSDK